MKKMLLKLKVNSWEIDLPLELEVVFGFCSFKFRNNKGIYHPEHSNNDFENWNIAYHNLWDTFMTWILLYYRLKTNYLMVTINFQATIYEVNITAWDMSKYGVISGPYFPVFGLNTENYGVNLRIQSWPRKMRTRKNSVFGHFSRSENNEILYVLKQSNHPPSITKQIPSIISIRVSYDSSCFNKISCDSNPMLLSKNMTMKMREKLKWNEKKWN